MSFIELWEFYEFGTKKQRFTGIVYVVGSEHGLDEGGELVRTHGMSYKYCRDLFQTDFGDKMGLDLVIENPDVPYHILKRVSRQLQIRGGKNEKF